MNRPVARKKLEQHCIRRCQQQRYQYLNFVPHNLYGINLMLNIQIKKTQEKETIGQKYTLS